MTHVNDVRKFIEERFLFGDESQMEETDSFLELGIIDSTGVLELVAFLEEKYSIKVNDDELVPENLDSLANISNYLSKKLSEK